MCSVVSSGAVWSPARALSTSTQCAARLCSHSGPGLQYWTQWVSLVHSSLARLHLLPKLAPAQKSLPASEAFTWTSLFSDFTDHDSQDEESFLSECQIPNWKAVKLYSDPGVNIYQLHHLGDLTTLPRVQKVILSCRRSSRNKKYRTTKQTTAQRLTPLSCSTPASFPSQELPTITWPEEVLDQVTARDLSVCILINPNKCLEENILLFLWNKSPSRLTDLIWILTPSCNSSVTWADTLSQPPHHPQLSTWRKVILPQ